MQMTIPLYLCEKNVEKVLSGLENVSSNLFQWFTENELKGNASKCHLPISSGEKVHVYHRLKSAAAKGY